MRNMTVDEERLKITASKEYEHIINARNFHYQEFNKWSRYFGLVVGALFVAYYKPDADMTFQILVALLGYIVSMCWYWSNKGYTYWWNHWSNFLQIAEKYREGGIPEADGVYTSFSYKKEGIFTNIGRYMNPLSGANVSTSKVVLLMSFSIACAWGVVLCRDIISNGSVIKNNSIIFDLLLSKESIVENIVMIKNYMIQHHLIILTGCFITYLISLIGTCFIKSNLSNHKTI